MLLKLARAAFLSRLLPMNALSGDLAAFTPFALFPPEVDEKGWFLGRDELGRPIFLDVEKLPSMHGVVLGTTGSGKSTLARHISLEAWKSGVNVWVIDPHGEEEYRRLIVERMGGVEIDLSMQGFDVTNHEGWVLGDYAQTLAEIVASSYGVPAMFSFSLKDGILRYLSRGERDALLSPLLSFNGELRISELVGKNVYVTMRGEKGRVSLQRMRIGVQVLLARLDGIMRSRAPTHAAKLLIVVDEAHNLFQLYEGSFLSQLYRESRKFGYSILSLVQIPSFLPEDIYSLAGFMVYLSGPKEYVEELARYSYLTRENIEWLLYRVRGNAVLTRQGDPRPRNIVLEPAPEALGLGAYGSLRRSSGGFPG